MITNHDASAALARVDALHTGLTQIVLEGGNLDRIAAEVARVLDVGVLFTSTDGRQRAAALPDEVREALTASDLVDPTGRLRVERIGGPRRRLHGPDEQRIRLEQNRPRLQLRLPRDLTTKATLLPAGQALGVTYQRPQTDRYNYPEDYLRARIIGMLGGRAAEEQRRRDP